MHLFFAINSIQKKNAQTSRKFNLLKAINKGTQRLAQILVIDIDNLTTKMPQANFLGFLPVLRRDAFAC